MLLVNLATIRSDVPITTIPMRNSHMVVIIDHAEMNRYRAVKMFYNLALDPRNLVEFKLKLGKHIFFRFLFVFLSFFCKIKIAGAGQLLAFDNLRK